MKKSFLLTIILVLVLFILGSGSCFGVNQHASERIHLTGTSQEVNCGALFKKMCSDSANCFSNIWKGAKETCCCVKKEEFDSASQSSTPRDGAQLVWRDEL